MENPTDSIVDSLGLGERLVAAFVGDDPKTGGEQARPEGVYSPKAESGDGVQQRVGQCEGGGVDV